MHLHHVAISVKDIEKSLVFYRDALGLTVFKDEIISGPEVDTALMESNARVRMVLLMDEAGNMIELLDWLSPQVRERPPEHRNFTSAGLAEVCFVVPNLQKAEEDLARYGLKFRTPIWPFGKGTDMFGGGYAEIRYTEDPNGVPVELMQLFGPGE
ncbi:MAG: VOC family protein [Dehalococcoidia bacterium]|nr:MAG: VOC family protein [Dehalococcoidia bacterium]